MQLHMDITEYFPCVFFLIYLFWNIVAVNVLWKHTGEQINEEKQRLGH